MNDLMKLKLGYINYNDVDNLKSDVQNTVAQNPLPAQDPNVQPLPQRANTQESIINSIGTLGQQYISNNQNIAPAKLPEDNGQGAFSGGEGLTANSAMGALTFGANIARSMAAPAPESGGEQMANTLNLAASGATAGATIGGPLGAAIGGGVGLIASLFGKREDKERKYREQREKINKETDQRKTERELEYYTKTKEGDLNKLINLKKSQLNYLDLNY